MSRVAHAARPLGTVFEYAPLAPPAPPEPRPEPDVAGQAALALAEARRAGYEAGRLEGLDAAQAQLRPALEALRRGLDDMAREREAIADALERDAVALALALAEKLVDGALSAEPERVLDVVRGALRRLAERAHVVVLVNPQDLALVREAIDGVAAELGGIEHCDVQAERRVGRGGAIVRTALGEVDASLEAKLAQARELLSADPDRPG